MISKYRNIGRQRAAQEGKEVVTAIDTFTDLLMEYDIDREQYDEQAIRKVNALPERYREEFRGAADALPVSTEDFRLYIFAYSDIADTIADGDPPAEGCTNVVVAGERTAHSHPLVLKNRDISGAGLRPQAVMVYPSIEDQHGFTTISSCGSVLVFQGVNDAGLVAANTFVNVDTDTNTRKEMLNGVLVRRILEECSTVVDAQTFVAECALNQIQGLTLALADGTDAAMLEIDPFAAEVRTGTRTVAARTNHYIESTSRDEPTDGESTAIRFARVRELANDLPEKVDRMDLFSVARDHHNGPGPDSICRHGSDNTGTHRLDQSTTVSTTVFQGGTPACRGLIGNPCRSSPVEISADESVLDDFQNSQL
jgi:hypothetical protein